MRNHDVLLDHMGTPQWGPHRYNFTLVGELKKFLRMLPEIFADLLNLIQCDINSSSAKVAII